MQYCDKKFNMIFLGASNTSTDNECSRNELEYQESLQDKKTKPLSFRESYPYLDTSTLSKEELQDLSDTLAKDTEDICSAFVKLVNHTFASLERKEISVEALRADTITSAFYCKSKPRCSQDHIDELSSAEFNSVRDIQVFLIRHKYISFLNFKILEDITDSYNIDKQPINEYLKKFRQFCKRSVFEVPSNVIKEHSPDGDEKFVVKISGEWFDKVGKESSPTSFTMKDLLDVQRKIKEVIGRAFVYVHGIKRGCVEITFVILSDIKLLPFSKPQLENLEQSCICVITQHSCSISSLATIMDPLHVSNLSASYAQVGKFEEALECARRCLELKPDYSEVRK